MTPIEALATIFALLILIKISIIFLNPKVWLKVDKTLLKPNPITTVIYLALIVVTGNYIFESMNVVEVAAVMMFVSLLMCLSYIPYYKIMMGLTKKVLMEKDCLKKAWLSILIWVSLAIWVLYTIYG